MCEPSFLEMFSSVWSRFLVLACLILAIREARALADSLATVERELASSRARPRRVESTPRRRSAAGLCAGSNSSTTTMAPPMDLGTAAVMISAVAVQHACVRRSISRMLHPDLASLFSAPLPFLSFSSAPSLSHPVAIDACRYTTTPERSSSSPPCPATGAPPSQGRLPSPRPRPPLCRPREPCIVLLSSNHPSHGSTSSSTTSRRAAQEPPAAVNGVGAPRSASSTGSRPDPPPPSLPRPRCAVTEVPAIAARLR